MTLSSAVATAMVDYIRSLDGEAIEALAAVVLDEFRAEAVEYPEMRTVAGDWPDDLIELAVLRTAEKLMSGLILALQVDVGVWQ